MPEEIETRPKEQESETPRMVVAESTSSEVSQENTPGAFSRLTPASLREWSQRPWLKILGGVLGVSILAGAIFGAYKLGQKQIPSGPVERPTPTPLAVATPTPDLTAGWEVILDKDNGYQFKMPPGWESYPGRGGTDRFVQRLKPFEVEVGGEKKEIQTQMIIELCKPPNCDVELAKNPIRDILPAAKESIIVGGYPATKEIFVSSEAPWQSKKSFRVIVEKGTSVYIIIWQDLTDTFNLMLSTFRFLEEATPEPGEPTRVEILKERCVIYPNPEDVEKYNLKEVPKKYCATCGDGVCDFIENCLPSHPITPDCGGGLYCPEDCE